MTATRKERRAGQPKAEAPRVRARPPKAGPPKGASTQVKARPPKAPPPQANKWQSKAGPPAVKPWQRKREEPEVEAVLPAIDPDDEWQSSPPRRSPARERPTSARRLPTDEPGAGGSRRPLSHTGGRVEQLSGPPELKAVIERSLGIDPERGVRDHVHGFHSYPARMHPGTAAGLVSALSPERGTVADPFCGCGTVLVEARRLGRKALGVDLNPIAVRLTRFKTEPLAAPARAALLEAAERVAEQAEARRKSAAGPTRRYPPEQRDAFDVHVLLELDGLSSGIKKEPAGPVRHALQLALSSIFSKVTRETNADVPAKRLASGFTIRFFVSRVEELVRQL